MEYNELTHHGVKGMKWGIRRKRQRVDDDTDAHEDSKRARDGKSAKSLSDTELRNRINRIQMEKQYAQLTAKQKSEGRKAVEKALTEVGTNIAKGYVQKISTALIEGEIKKIAAKSVKNANLLKKLGLYNPT